MLTLKSNHTIQNQNQINQYRIQSKHGWRRKGNNTS